MARDVADAAIRIDHARLFLALRSVAQQLHCGSPMMG
jgi:hypothetical protein